MKVSRGMTAMWTLFQVKLKLFQKEKGRGVGRAEGRGRETEAAGRRGGWTEAATHQGDGRRRDEERQDTKRKGDRGCGTDKDSSQNRHLSLFHFLAPSASLFLSFPFPSYRSLPVSFLSLPLSPSRERWERKREREREKRERERERAKEKNRKGG